MLYLSTSVEAHGTEDEAVATWDPYDACNSDCYMAVVPSEGCMADEPKPDGLVPGEGRMAEEPKCDGLVPGEGSVAEEPKPDAPLCAMCLFTAMQKGKEHNSQVEEALTKSQRRYFENGYKELEKLTHETYEQSP